MAGKRVVSIQVVVEVGGRQKSGQYPGCGQGGWGAEEWSVFRLRLRWVERSWLATIKAEVGADK